MNSILFLAVAFFVFGGLVLSIIAMLYMSYTQLNEVIETMSKASGRAKRAPFYKGLKGRFHLMIDIGGLVMCPQAAIKLGTATQEEIDSLPTSFKKRIKAIFWTKCVLAVIGCALLVADEYG